MKTRVIVVGIGGASSVGKSTLVKHLQSILPCSVVIHQDDFVPLQEDIPIHPVYHVQDWDTPATAIDWPRFICFLQRVKEDGEIPVEHRSYEDLNQNPEVLIDAGVTDHWMVVFKNLQKTRESDDERVLWVLVDGFLLYWKREVIELLDTKILLRAPERVLRERRQNRQWHMEDKSDPNGTVVWHDSPGYWEQIVWPAYIAAHRDLFEDHDVENGALGTKIPGLILVETLKISMSDAVDTCCRSLKNDCEK